MQKAYEMGAERKVVLITGCSSGIGRALAEAMRDHSYEIFATARKPETLKDLLGEHLHALALDVTDLQSIKSAVEEIIRLAGRVDILVNNAGFGLIGPVAELSLDKLRLQFETNVLGQVAVSQAVIPHMVRQGGGIIANIGSVSGVTATPYAGAYCASKAAINSLSDAMRMELAPFGIKVISVQPGGIRSKFGETAAESVSAEPAGESLYANAEKFLAERARMSQSSPTSAEDFAAKLLEQMEKADPPAVWRYGHGAHQLPFVKQWLPTSVLDSILSKKFGLNKLKK